MWEIPGCRGIDASVISRVLKGERLFTSRQISVFGSVLGLSPRQKLDLEQSLRDDWSQKIGIDRQEYSAPTPLGLLEFAVSKLATEKFLLPFDRLFDLNCEIECQLTEALKHSKSQTQTDHILAIYTSAIINLAYCRSQVIFNWSEAVRDRLKAHSEILKHQAAKTHNPFLHQLSGIIFKPYHHYRGEFCKTDDLIRSIKPDEVQDEYWRTDLYYSALIANGALHRNVEVDKLEDKLVSSDNSYSDPSLVRLHIGLSKAAKRLGKDSAVHSHFSFSQIHHSQTNRSHELYNLRYAQLLSLKANLQPHIPQVKDAVLEVTRKIGHLRYQNELLNLPS
jgi:hypothetical protein